MSVINKALSSSLSGIQSGLSSAAQRADRISKAFTTEEGDGGDNVVSDFVGFKLDLYQVGANRKVISITQKLEQSVLDIIA